MEGYQQMLEEQRIREAEYQRMLMQQQQSQAMRVQGGQQQGGGMENPISPNTAINLAQKFGGAGGGGAGGASVAGLASGEAPVAAGSLYGGFGSAPVAVGAAEGLGAGGAAASGGGAAGGGAAGGGALAAAGPWAALAAAIFLNEKQAQDKGRRDHDFKEEPKEYMKDVFTAKVLDQDVEKLGDKIGGVGGQFTKVMGRLGTPRGIGHTLEKSLKPWEWF